MKPIMAVLCLALLPAAAWAQGADGGRVIVTGRTAAGVSVVVETAPPKTIDFATSGLRFVQAWGTRPDAEAPPPGEEPTPIVDTFFPPPGGTRLVLFEMPTAEEDARSFPDAAAFEAFERELTAKVPDLAAAFGDPEHPSMHRTASVDYVIVLRGDVELELDDGSRTRLRPGDVVVQNATAHAWHNVGEERAMLAAFIVGVPE